MFSIFGGGGTASASAMAMTSKAMWLQSLESEESSANIPSLIRRRKSQGRSLNPINHINPPHFALPSSVFWDFVFPALDQRGFSALASTCHEWYKLFWEEDLWARIRYVSFTDKGMRKARSRSRIRSYWYKLLFKLGLGDQKIEARTLKLLRHKRFSQVPAAKITCFLGASPDDSVPSCLSALLDRMPGVQSLYIGGRGGSTLRWSQYKVFSELVKLAPNLRELLIPSYPPKGKSLIALFCLRTILTLLCSLDVITSICFALSSSLNWLLCLLFSERCEGDSKETPFLPHVTLAELDWALRLRGMDITFSGKGRQEPSFACAHVNQPRPGFLVGE